MKKEFILMSVFFVLILGFVSFASASFDLTITSGTVGSDETSDLIVTTSTSSTSDVDGFDLQAPSLPEAMSVLTSDVSGTALVVDSWAGEDRDFNLAYGPIITSGFAEFESSAFNSSYSAVLQDCGSDNTYSSCDTNLSLSHTGETNSIDISEDEVQGYRYLKLVVSLITLAAVDEADTVNDNTGDSGGSSGGGGGAGLSNLAAPIIDTLTINPEAGTGEQIVFQSAGAQHSVSIVGIREGEADVVIQSNPVRVTLILGEKKLVDLNGDGEDDISVKLLFVDLKNNAVKIEVSPLKVVSSITISPNDFALNVLLGKETNKEVTVTNTGNSDLTLAIDTDTLGDAVLVDKTLSLKKGETKKLNLKFKVFNKGIVNGKVLFKQGNQVFAELPIILNVKSENFLFDSAISIGNLFGSRLKQGETLRGSVVLNEVGNANEKVDVVATYVIKDFYGNEYLKDSETFAVQGSKRYTKEFDTSNLPEGKYVLGLEIVYPGAFAVSSVEFQISNSFIGSSVMFMLIVLVIMVGVVVGLVIWASKRKQSFSKFKMSKI